MLLPPPLSAKLVDIRMGGSVTLCVSAVAAREALACSSNSNSNSIVSSSSDSNSRSNTMIRIAAAVLPTAAAEITEE